MKKLDVDLLRRLHRQWNDTEYGISPVECDQVMMQIPAVLAELEHLLTLSRELVRRGPASAAWEPFFDAVAELSGAWKPPATLTDTPPEAGAP